MLPESHGFVVVPVTRSNNFVSLHKLDRDKLEHVSLIQLVADIATPQVSATHQLSAHGSSKCSKLSVVRWK